MRYETNHAPWEQFPGESKPAFDAFVLYRDGERSIPKVVRKCTKSESLIKRWSSRWRWVERARTWDAERDRVKREAFLKASVEIGIRYATVAENIFSKIAERLLHLNVEDMPVAQLPQWLKIVMEVEYRARGVSLEPERAPVNVQIENHVTQQATISERRRDLSKLTVEELEQLDILLAKAEDGSEPVEYVPSYPDRP